MLNPNATWRLSETLKNLSKVADAEIDVRNMVATIGRHNAVRKLTEVQKSSLRQAAEATAAACDDESGGIVEELSSQGNGQKRKRDCESSAISSVEAVQAPIVLTKEQEESRERCVEYLSSLKHDLYLHFKNDCVGILDIAERKKKYNAARVIFDELLGIVVSDNQRLSNKVNMLTFPMMRGGEDDTEHSLNERVSNINTVIATLNVNRPTKLLKVELGTLLEEDDDSFFE